MKLQFFLLLLAALLTGAQSTAQHVSIEDADFDTYFFNKENIPKVSGRILNLTKEQIAKTRIEYSTVTPFEEFQVKNDCALNSDGTFELKFDYAFPYQQVWINIDSLFYTGIYANKDLFIELDAAILKTQAEPYFTGPGIRYLGTDGPLNEYINKNAVYRREQKAVLEQARHGISHNSGAWK